MRVSTNKEIVLGAQISLLQTSSCCLGPNNSLPCAR